MLVWKVLQTASVPAHALCMKPKTALTCTLVLLFLLPVMWYLSKLTFVHRREHPQFKLVTGSDEDTLLRTMAGRAKRFSHIHALDTTICFLVDFGLSSGKNRFFVYDLPNDSAILMGLVSHGRCNEWWLDGRKYGNTPGCGCSALGRYRVGNAYRGKFGLAYRLTGMDSSNNNAFKRNVVLHAHQCVPLSETEPFPVCQSDGCPMVAPAFLDRLGVAIKKARRPILLWIFDSHTQSAPERVIYEESR